MNMNDYNRVTSRIEPSDRCRNEVLDMNGERKRKIVRNNTGSRTAAIAAAAVLIAGGAGITGFHFLTNGTSGPGTDPEPTTAVSATEEATDTAETLIEEGTIEITTEEAEPEISFSVNGTACINSDLVFDIQAKLPYGFDAGNGMLTLSADIIIDGKEINDPALGGDPFSVDMYSDSETNTFNGKLSFFLPDAEQFTGSKEVNVRLYNPAIIQFIDNGDMQGEDRRDLNGEFTFNAEIEAKGKSNVIEKDGFKAVIIKNTPDMIICGGIETSDLDDYLEAKGWDTSDEGYKYNGVHPVFLIVDENNNELTPIPGDDNGFLESVDLNSGGQLAVSCYRPPTDKIRCVFVDKNQHPSPLGTEEITGQHGTYSYEIIAEIPIDLSQYPMESE